MSSARGKLTKHPVPCVRVPAAIACTVDDNPAAIYGYFGGLNGYLIVLQHAVRSFSHGPWVSLVLFELLKTSQSLSRINTYGVKVYMSLVLRVDISKPESTEGHRRTA